MLHFERSQACGVAVRHGANRPKAVQYKVKRQAMDGSATAIKGQSLVSPHTNKNPAHCRFRASTPHSAVLGSVRMKLTALIAAILMQGVGLPGQYLNVDYCKLVRDPATYDHKRVTVTATYRYGFEWQELYCLKCRDSGKTWVEIPNDPPSELKRALRGLPKWTGTLNGTFRGVFHSKGGFGDGGYKFALAVEHIDAVSVVSRSGAVPEALSASERSKVCR